MASLKLKNKKEGMLLAIILIFAFIMAGLLFSIISLSSSVKSQTKKTIAQYQAYLMGESAIQHAKMHLILLPREIAKKADEAPGANIFDSAKSNNDSQLDSLLFSEAANNFDLFSMDLDTVKTSSPYEALYTIVSLTRTATAKTSDGTSSKRTGTTSTFKIEVSSRIGKENSITVGADPKDFLYESMEEFTVSAVGLGDF
ncbi:MAG: hypothetical protein GX221_10930 [Candidatus Riflebacteria bacterium]|nr:hypothetical protein [Candidatus Riflebacteria bacterium]